MMKAILIAAATILQAYLLGSVDTGILVSKFVYHDDVRNHGSGAAGMTNMLRTFGKKAAAMTATGDVLKGVLAVCIGRWLFHMLPADAGVSPYLGVYLAAIFAVLGHLYPLYFGFKGGKGVLVAAGAILAIQPVLLPFLAIIFLVCLIPTGMVSLGSVAMAALYPVLTIIYGSLQGYAAGDMLVCAIGSGFMSGMVIYMHRANIQRIREGKEYREELICDVIRMGAAALPDMRGESLSAICGTLGLEQLRELKKAFSGGGKLNSQLSSTKPETHSGNSEFRI
mgnify:CR=1 FL=1